MVEPSTVLSVYLDVIQDVITNVQEVFQEEGIDEQVLFRLKDMWESKLKASKTAEYEQDKIHFQTVQVENEPEPTHKPKDKNAILTERFVPMQVNLPLNAHSNATRSLIIYVPIRVVNHINIQNLLPPSIIQSTIGLPPQLATTILQQYINNALKRDKLFSSVPKNVLNFNNLTDGNSDSSDSEDSDDFDDILKYLDGEDDFMEEEEENFDEVSLNSEDDVTDEETPEVLFDSDNVIVCQYYKIKRCKNRWKLCFKDGIMHLEGKDFLFLKAAGDVHW